MLNAESAQDFEWGRLEAPAQLWDDIDRRACLKSEVPVKVAPIQATGLGRNFKTGESKLLHPEVQPIKTDNGFLRHDVIVYKAFFLRRSIRPS